jgi:paraquat-inducible protein B
MSKKASPAVIGAFVLGAAALSVIALVVFGSGKFFKVTREFVLFFEGSVQGLSRGAPVAFRGVRIGSVKDIKIVMDARDLSLKIPVIIEIEEDRMGDMPDRRHELDAVLQEQDADTLVDYLVQKGLRAQLELQSLLTGQLFVNLDFFPDRPLRLSGYPTSYTELPTIPSGLEELSKKVEKLPIEDLASNALRAIQGIDRWVNSPDLQEAATSLKETVIEVKGIAQAVNRQIQPMLLEATQSFTEAKGLLRETRTQVKPLASDTRKLVTNADQRISQLAVSVETTLKAAQAAFAKAEAALSSVQGTMGADSSLRYELQNTLKELSNAARAVRTVADYLERHPDALLRGKPKSGEQ